MFKKIIKSILRLFLFSATVHNCILVFWAITKGNIKYVNYFGILSLDEFWPEITKGGTSDLISLLIVLLIFSTLLLWEIFKKKKKFAR